MNFQIICTALLSFLFLTNCSLKNDPINEWEPNPPANTTVTVYFGQPSATNTSYKGGGGQQSGGSNVDVVGIVNDASGQPIDEVLVKLEDTDEPVSYTTNSDQLGDFFKYGVKEGEYILSYEHLDYQTVSRTVFLDGSGGPSIDLGTEELLAR